MSTTATQPSIQPRARRLVLGILSIALATGITTGVVWATNQDTTPGAGPRDNPSVTSRSTRTETMEEDYASVLEDRAYEPRRRVPGSEGR